MSRLRYPLDTNICIYIINRCPPGLFAHLDGLRAGEVGISGITGAEPDYGVSTSGSPRNRQALDKFLAPLDVLPFDEAAMRRYGDLRHRLGCQGTPTGALGQLIAAHAVAPDAVLASNNLREFEWVPGPRLENWVNE